MESFAYMDLLGEITMKNPDIILTVFEECMHNILMQCIPYGTEDPLQMWISMGQLAISTKGMVTLLKCFSAGWYVHWLF